MPCGDAIRLVPADTLRHLQGKSRATVARNGPAPLSLD